MTKSPNIPANLKTKPSVLKWTFAALFTGAVLVLSVPFYVRMSTKHRQFSRVAQAPEKEFAIVPGAGIRTDGRPGFFLKQRLDDAFLLYKNGKVKKILLTGDNGDHRHDEISVMNNYLLRKGVPQRVIFGDYAGFDTYSSMERAQAVFSIDNAVIVSQAFHLPRSVYIARYKGIDAVGFSTEKKHGRRQYFLREWGATIKSVFDCLRGRKAKFYGPKVNTDKSSNIRKDQLKRT